MSHANAKRDQLQRFLDLLPEERVPPGGAIASAVILSAGVLLLGWSPAVVMGFYWLENLVHGGFHAWRMQALDGRLADAGLQGALERATHLDPAERQRQLDAAAGCVHAIAIPFFFLHYGGFCAGHLIFVAVFFPEWSSGFFTLGGLLAIAVMLWTHARMSLQFRRRSGIRALPRILYMFAAYDRVIVLHVTLVLGGALILAGGANLAVLLLIALKLWSDLRGGFSLLGQIRRWAHKAG